MHSSKYFQWRFWNAQKGGIWKESCEKGEGGNWYNSSPSYFLFPSLIQLIYCGNLHRNVDCLSSGRDDPAHPNSSLGIHDLSSLMRPLSLFNSVSFLTCISFILTLLLPPKTIRIGFYCNGHSIYIYIAL